MIGEVVITARQPDILLRGDTTVINAQNFKTPPGSYLETLMSRIPGLIYDRQKKTLVYHGKNIEGVCVNGQTFFNNDIEIALKNLSVDLISKIKIYDKRDERPKWVGVRSTNSNRHSHPTIFGRTETISRFTPSARMPNKQYVTKET